MGKETLNQRLLVYNHLKRRMGGAVKGELGKGEQSPGWVS